MAKKQPKRSRKRKYKVGETKRKFGGKTYELVGLTNGKNQAKQDCSRQKSKNRAKSCRIVKTPETKKPESNGRKWGNYSIFARY